MSPSTVIDDEVKPSAELELPPPDPPELPELPLELPPPQAASTHAAAVATAAVVRRALFMRSSSISSRAIARVGNSRGRARPTCRNDDAGEDLRTAAYER